MKRASMNQRWSRRGAGVAAVVLMLVLLNLSILGVVGASGDDLSLAAMRLESCLAFYAAESGERHRDPPDLRWPILAGRHDAGHSTRAGGVPLALAGSGGRHGRGGRAQWRFAAPDRD